MVFGILLLAFRRRGSSRSEADETRMIQEIYQGMNELTRRIETLETVLLEKSRKREDNTDDG